MQIFYTKIFLFQQTFAAWRIVFLLTAGVSGAFALQFDFFAQASVQPWNTYWKKIGDEEKPEP